MAEELQQSIMLVLLGAHRVIGECEPTLEQFSGVVRHPMMIHSLFLPDPAGSVQLVWFVEPLHVDRMEVTKEGVHGLVAMSKDTPQVRAYLGERAKRAGIVLPFPPDGDPRRRA